MHIAACATSRLVNRAAIFDLDGTLIDSLGDIASLMNETLTAAGLPQHAEDAYAAFVGGGVRVLAERATASLVDAGRHIDVAALERDFRERYRAKPVQRTVAYDGVLSLLAALRERSVKLAILSNKPHGLTTTIAEQLFAEEGFMEIWGHKQELPKKPDPTTAFAVAKLLEVAPEACVFIGDTEVDMLTATRAGMTPIGVSWGFRPAAELRAHGAVHVLERPNDLLQSF